MRVKCSISRKKTFMNDQNSKIIRNILHSRNLDILKMFSVPKKTKIPNVIVVDND